MRQNLQFFVNGQLVVVDGPQAFWPLSRYLRESRRLVGTKIVCGEGDCGACTVLIADHKQRAAEEPAALHYRSIDSCIVFLHQLDRTSIITVEGIASDDGTLSCVQSAMVSGHGSQCGFCTPGFVMTLHGEREERLMAGGTTLADMPPQDLKIALSGNLCRCTGYVQIIDAARNADAAAEHTSGMNDRYPAGPMIEHFESLGDQPVAIDHQGDDSRRRVFVPRTIQQALRFRSDNPTCRIISGATDVGVWHNHGKPIGEVALVISDIEALREIEVSDASVRFGAAATWREVLQTVEDQFAGFDSILLRFGSPQIRNIGSIGGNLVNGSPIADSIPFLMACDASIELTSANDVRSIPIRDFYTGYKTTVMRDDEIMTAIVVPRPSENERLFLHKVSRRRDMDISTLTAGILLRIDGDVITECRVAMGGVGPVVVRCEKAEAALRGKRFEEQAFRRAADAVADDISAISDVRGDKSFRDTLAANMFLKCFHEMDGQTEISPPVGVAS